MGMEKANVPGVDSPSSGTRVRSTVQWERRCSFRWAPYHQRMPRYTAHEGSDEGKKRCQGC